MAGLNLLAQISDRISPVLIWHNPPSPLVPFSTKLADPPPPIDPYVLILNGWSPSRTKMLPKSSLGPVLFGLTVVLR